VPLDLGQGAHAAGAWTWWRFLSEYFGTAKRPAPQVVQRIWEAAADSDRDSLTATRDVLIRLGTKFQRAFADYSALSHVSRRWYFEGADAPYPEAPMARDVTLTGARPGTGEVPALELDHLTSANVAVRRSRSLGDRAQLRIWVDGPPRDTGPTAEVTLHRTDGSLAWRSVRLDQDGDGVLTVPFGRGRISHVVLTLVNASPRSDCDRGTTLACGGVPLDDARPFTYRALALR
jgi:hypothetical protein